jgi:hypothetical protein
MIGIRRLCLRGVKLLLLLRFSRRDAVWGGFLRR